MTEEKGLVDIQVEKYTRPLTSSLNPGRPLTAKGQRPIGKIGPDRTLADGGEKPLDDERAKRKLVDPVQDGHLLVND